MLRNIAPLYRSLLLSISNATPTTASSTGVHSLMCERQQSHLQANTSSAAYATTSTRSNQPLADPWIPTSQLIKRKTHQKRARRLIQVLEDEQMQRLKNGKAIPEFRSGDILEVTTVVPEADRKVYTYKGVCVARANKGPRSWFKIYNVFPDVGGFVQHFPLYMPDMVSIKVVGRLQRAKRSKLYHLLQDEGPKHIYQTAVSPPK